METREDVVARIKDVADIVQIIGENVNLRKSGARFLGLCPFHGEKTPSFTVHPGNQFFYCFGCGESGDVFSFVMKYYNLDFPEALKNLAKRYNIALPERKVSAVEKKKQELSRRMYAVNEKAAALFSSCLESPSHAASAIRYLEQRGIPLPVQKQFGLGYAPSPATAGWNFLGNQLSRDEKEAAIEAGLLSKKDRGRGTYDRFRDRILFPIYNISGQVCGFGGRIVGEGQPKYMNSPESSIYNKSRSLLGLYQSKEAVKRHNQAILVEGNFDMISLVAHGVENVVAPLGTALTREQLRLLRRFADEGVLLFDGDTAGVNAAVRAVPLFFAEQMKGRVVLLPEGHDPDTFVREHGGDALRRLVETGQELSEFVFAQLVQEHGLSLEGKSRIVEELKPIVRAASSSLQRSVIIAHFAEKLSMPVDMFAHHLRQTIGSPASKDVERQSLQTAKKQTKDKIAIAPSQKKLAAFMILHPEKFQKLADAGLRDCLAGSLGEILFLQLRELVSINDMVEPEDLLGRLPEGAERQFVSHVLLSAPPVDDDEDDRSEEMDCLIYLEQFRLKKQSAELLDKIKDAQHNENYEQLQKYLEEKQKIDLQIKGIV